MENLSAVAKKIIEAQENVVGPLAWSEAKKVAGLEINDRNVNLTGNSKSVLEGLVNQYATLFGEASVAVCRQAVRPLLANVKKDDIPQILQ